MKTLLLVAVLALLAGCSAPANTSPTINVERAPPSFASDITQMPIQGWFVVFFGERQSLYINSKTIKIQENQKTAQLVTVHHTKPFMIQSLQTFDCAAENKVRVVQIKPDASALEQGESDAVITNKAAWDVVAENSLAGLAWKEVCQNQHTLASQSFSQTNMTFGDILTRLKSNTLPPLPAAQ